MGGGSWTSKDFASYSTARGLDISYDSSGYATIANKYSTQDLYSSNFLQDILNPYGVVRQCCDSEEHPNTIPVILALDVTGSMGGAATAVARKLNEVMTRLYEQVPDVEFCIMGIGDLDYDAAPIQISQFESDIRIATQLDKVYFEGGGGGNGFESYTAAWYMGSRHTDLDCWKRGQKGIIITMGDEPLNPYLPKKRLAHVTGDNLEADIETSALYKEVTEKFDVYHLAVKDEDSSYEWHKRELHKSFGKYFDEDHLRVVTLDNIANVIVDIISKSTSASANVIENPSEGIAW